VGLKEYLYFLMAPTLIYETEYPRTTAIRWKHFLLLSLQAFASCFVMYVIITEDLIPVYHASVTFPLWRAVFRLSLPSFAMWLLIFYLLFHCILGMIAEVTKFADREFYLCVSHWIPSPLFLVLIYWLVLFIVLVIGGTPGLLVIGGANGIVQCIVGCPATSTLTACTQ
jgi:hypothetical protein